MVTKNPLFLASVGFVAVAMVSTWAQSRAEKDYQACRNEVTSEAIQEYRQDVVPRRKKAEVVVAREKKAFQDMLAKLERRTIRLLRSPESFKLPKSVVEDLSEAFADASYVSCKKSSSTFTADASHFGLTGTDDIESTSRKVTDEEGSEIYVDVHSAWQNVGYASEGDASVQFGSDSNFCKSMKAGRFAESRLIHYQGQYLQKFEESRFWREVSISNLVLDYAQPDLFSADSSEVEDGFPNEGIRIYKNMINGEVVVQHAKTDPIWQSESAYVEDQVKASCGDEPVSENVKPDEPEDRPSGYDAGSGEE